MISQILSLENTGEEIFVCCDDIGAEAHLMKNCSYIGHLIPPDPYRIIQMYFIQLKDGSKWNIRRFY